MKLWGRITSINVMKVLWALDELGLEYEREDAGMDFGVIDTPEYLELNPNGRIPTLEDEEIVLWESNTIVRHLAECYGEGSLLPDDYYDRALASQWMDWQQTTLHSDLTYIFWGDIRNSLEHQNLQRKAKNVEQLNRAWGVLDYWLTERDFVVGDRLTMADIPLGCAAWRWHNLEIEHLHFPNMARWYSHLKTLPAFTEHVAKPLA